MQPFTAKTIFTLLLAAGCYFIVQPLFTEKQGLIGIVIRSITYCTLFAAGAFTLKLSPDLQPVLMAVKKRLGFVR